MQPVRLLPMRCVSIRAFATMKFAWICAMLGLIGGILGGCQDDDQKRKEYFEIWRMPERELIDHLRAVPIKEHVAMYAFGIERLKPPDFALLPVILNDGAATLPYLKDEIDNPSNAAAITELVMPIYILAVRQNLRQAVDFAPQVAAWCARIKTTRPDCQKMSDEMNALYPKAPGSN